MTANGVNMAACLRDCLISGPSFFPMHETLPGGLRIRNEHSDNLKRKRTVWPVVSCALA